MLQPCYNSVTTLSMIYQVLIYVKLTVICSIVGARKNDKFDGVQVPPSMAGDMFWQLEKADNPINGTDASFHQCMLFMLIIIIKVIHLSVETNFESSMYPH